MGAMGVMPKGSKKVKFRIFAFFKIGCGHYGRYGRYGHYAKRLKKGGIWKSHGFPKLAVGTMGATGVMPKGSKKVKFGKRAVFQNWLWALWALWTPCQKVEKR